MKLRTTRDLAIAAVVAAAFALGTWSGSSGAARDLLEARLLEARLLEAQGRGTQPPPTAPRPVPTQPVVPGEPLVYGMDSGSGGGANGFIAVTGSYGIGTSVLYVLDTAHRQLAVYEARGGSSGSRQLVLVGARRIDLDLRLEGYNDESDFSYRELKALFERRGGDSGDAREAATAPATRRTGGGRSPK